MRKLVSISNREVELIRTENVYSTTDYSIFNISEMNRIIKLGNVSAIKNSILLNGQQKPIIIDSDFFIIDGQHRFSALKSICMPVEFIFANNLGQTEKEKLNVMESQNTSFSWSNYEKLVLRAKIDDNYLRLKNLVDNFGFPIVSTCNILWGRQVYLKAKHIKNDVTKLSGKSIGFSTNDMIITNEMVMNSIWRFENFKDLALIHQVFKRANVISSLMMLNKHQGLNFNHLIEKANKYSSKITDLTDSSKIIPFIEKLYNYNSKKPVYFMEHKRFLKLNK